MSAIYKEIKGDSAYNLELDKSSDIKYTSMTICNKHTANADVDLYISKIDTKQEREGEFPNSYDEYGRGQDGDYTPRVQTTSDYYILHDVAIPPKSTLVYDLNFDWSTEYSLYIKLDDSNSVVDVIINGTNTKASINKTSSGSSSY